MLILSGANQSATNSVEKCDKQFSSRGRQLKKCSGKGSEKCNTIDDSPFFRPKATAFVIKRQMFFLTLSL